MEVGNKCAVSVKSLASVTIQQAYNMHLAGFALQKHDYNNGDALKRVYTLARQAP